jgi:uncharacterized protein (TIGR00369 family)
MLSRESLQEILATSFPGATVPTVEEVHENEVIVRLAIKAEHGRPGNTVSGPTLMMLADTGAWMVILAHIGPVLHCVTTSLSIDFLRKPELKDLLAKAELLKLGRSLAVVSVKIYSEGSSKVVASAQVTYSIPPDH